MHKVGKLEAYPTLVSASISAVSSGFGGKRELRTFQTGPGMVGSLEFLVLSLTSMRLSDI